MNKFGFLVVLVFIATLSSAQQRYKVTYQQLKEYEGLYEYFNHATIKIAASPVDTILIWDYQSKRLRPPPC